MFSNSEEQFKELLNQLVARSKKSLLANSFPVFGLLLTEEGNTDVVLGVVEDGDLSEIINNVQQELIEKKNALSILAACLAYPDFNNQCVVAYLENHESYQLRCDIPVLNNDVLELDIENLTTKDGSTIVFGNNDVA